MKRARVVPCLSALLVLAACAAAAPDGPAPTPAERMAARRAELWATGAYDAPGWERMTPPRPGEWLARFPEPGQTFDELCAEARPLRGAIVLQPLAPLRPRAQAVLDVVRRHGSVFFGGQVALAEPAPLVTSAFVERRGQYDADQLLEALTAIRPRGAALYAGVADRDLFSAPLNYVFGLGRFHAGLGVYSLARFDGEDVDDALYRRRAVALLAHELGHGLGLHHCIYYRCVMNGSNSLAETDGQPIEPCPVCLRKLAWARGLDVRARWEALAPVLDEAGLAEDAAWVRARLADLKASGKRVPWRE